MRQNPAPNCAALGSLHPPGQWAHPPNELFLVLLEGGSSERQLAVYPGVQAPMLPGEVWR
jgi:hypothetical protein